MGMNGQDITLFINGATYVVGVEPKMKRADIYINNQYFMTHRYKNGNVGGQLEDIAIVLDGTMCIIAIRTHMFWAPIRIAINGRYIDNGEPYIPAVVRPAWFVVFYILNALAILFCASSAGSIIALLSTSCCMMIINSCKMTNTGKILICCGVVLGVWAFAFFFGFILGDSLWLRL